jgi:Chaperone of endosialidase
VSMSAPAPPDPVATAEAQQTLNENTAKYQAETNNVNQTTPYGSLSYEQTGTNPDGSPIFSANTTLNPAEQQLFNNTVSTQNTVGQDAGTLAKNLGSSLTSAPNLSTSALTNEMLGWQENYMEPWFNQQTSNLNSQLANQGITQGSQAWQNAQLGNTEGQAGTIENAMAQDESQAYNQALQTYQAPIQTLGTLLGEGQPASVNQGLVQTPQEQIQPANEEALVQQDYQSQLQNYQNTMSGLFSIPSALLGGWARAGFGMPSDRRLKRDISQIGAMADGTPIYRFRYLNDNRMQIGLMAQDIAETVPEAVAFDDRGFMMVDYERATENAARRANG